MNIWIIGGVLVLLYILIIWADHDKEGKRRHYGEHFPLDEDEEEEEERKKEEKKKRDDYFRNLSGGCMFF